MSIFELGFELINHTARYVQNWIKARSVSGIMASPLGRYHSSTSVHLALYFAFSFCTGTLSIVPWIHHEFRLGKFEVD